MSATLRPTVLLALLALAAPAAADTLKVPGQFPTINAAILAATAGDTVIVAKGTYLEQVFVGVAGIKLVGKGAVIDGQYAGVCIDIQADDVSVAGFTLANGLMGLFAVGAGTTVIKCDVRNCASVGIALQGGGCKVAGNTVTGCGDDGINFLRTAAGETVIEKNTCTQNGEEGIAVTGDEFTLAKNRCERNALNGVFATIEGFKPTAAPVGLPVLIEKNTCLDNGNGLLLLNGTATTVTIQKNDLSGNADAGLFADSLNATVITGNRCDDNGESGILLRTGFAQVSKNSAEGNRGDGIRVEQAAPLGDGGGFGTGDSNELDGNTCRDNRGDGIAIGTGATFSAVKVNKCTGNGDDGIDVDDAAITGTTLFHNTCIDNGHEGIDNSGQATVITNNVCKNNGEGIGPDIGGAGDAGAGTVSIFAGNKFGTGGETTLARLDNYVDTGP
jgi:parallel beta-helix repeat protein